MSAVVDISHHDSRAPLTVRPLADADYARWDRFVLDCPRATFFHRVGWRPVIERAFGHRTHFLLAERAGAIEGVLPLTHVKSLLFGNALISNAFCVYGGPAAVTDAARDALLARAVELAGELGVDYLELRNREPYRADWPRKALYVTFRKAIDPDPEVNLNAIPRKQRAMVRKGIQAGLEGVIEDDPDKCHRIYSESVRNLGTPVFPARYFRILKQVFGNDCEILTVRHGGDDVASVMSFYFRDEVLPYYGGGTALARELKANDFMYWDLMRRAAERGLRWFDYGRSKEGAGSYSFKKNWGFEPEPLHYEFHLEKATALPDVNPMNPKYQLFINAWKKLPLPVSRVIGPWIARSLG